MRISRLHGVVLVVFAGLLGLVEGPAEIACVAGLVTTGLAGGYRWRPGWIEAGIALWWAAGLPGTLLAVGKVQLSSEACLRPLLALGYVLGARGIARAEPRILARMAAAFLLALALNGAYGYLQVTLGRLPLEHWLLKNRTSPQIWEPDHINGTLAASGLYYNRLKLAHVGVLCLGLAWLLARETSLSTRARLAAAGTGVVLAGAVVLTYARMALLAGLIAATLLSLVLGRWRGALAVAVAGAAALAAVLAFKSGFANHLRGSWADADIRVHLFRTALALFRSHPLLGVGHGLYRPMAAPIWDGQGALMDAHNFALQVLAETGVVGFTGFALAAGGSLLIVLRAVRRSARSPSSAGAHDLLDRFALFGLIFFTVLGVTHVPTHHAPVALAFWCLVGIARGARRPAAG